MNPSFREHVPALTWILASDNDTQRTQSLISGEDFQ